MKIKSYKSNFYLLNSSINDDRLSSTQNYLRDRRIAYWASCRRQLLERMVLYNPSSIYIYRIQELIFGKIIVESEKILEDY